MKIRDIKKLGRYYDRDTMKEYNVYKGTYVGRSTEIIYYLYRGVRMPISDRDFYGNYVKIPNP